MGQAFRRASGRFKPPESAPTSKTVIDRHRPPERSTDYKVDISRTTTTQNSNRNNLDSGQKSSARVNTDNVLEQRDPQFDAMLNQMVGRIRTKPGGKHEMGEAAVVERYDRPMPKLRNTKQDSSRYEERPTPPGTVNVAQLRHIMLLHKGKADDHKGPMDAHQIAEKFRLEVAHVQQILQSVSLPPEGSTKEESFQ